MKIEILSKLKNIRLFLFDLEGVLLFKNDDENIFISEIQKAVTEFINRDLIFGIISAREEDSLIKKLKEINGCNVLASSLEKVKAADILLRKFSIEYKNVFYMGDEVIDIPLMQKCSLAVAPKIAKREVKRNATYITNALSTGELFEEIFSLIDKSKKVFS